MSKRSLLLLCFGIECLLILLVAAACGMSGLGFALFYNLGYGVLTSVLLPLALAGKRNDPWSSFGIKPLQPRQYAVLTLFVFLSIGGQLLPLLMQGTPPPLELLPICALPLIMTTFFEEFLFRGFLQSRLEQKLGWPLAILISGLLFSLYHLGYPGFRTAEDLLLLFAVGIGFATAFKLSGNHLFVSYFVNLPNAFLTYLLKSKQFPVLTWASSFYAVIAISLVAFSCFFYTKLHAPGARRKEHSAHDA